MKFRYKTNIAYLILIKVNPWIKLKMDPNSDSESRSFNPCSVNEELQHNEPDPDVNYYLDEISSLDTKYYVLDEVRGQLKSFRLNSFVVLHLNIRNMKKHFETFQDLIEFLNFKFNAICTSETWLTKFQTQIFGCKDIIAFT